MQLRILLPLAAIAALLAACGGDSGTPATPSAAHAMQGARAGAVASDYRDTMQRVYVAYFGRPADVGGWAWYSDRLLDANAPTGIVAVATAYGSNAALREQIDQFGTSAESARLYPGTNTAFVTAIYRNLFNRDPDSAGLDYWAGQIDKGIVTRSLAAVAIIAGSSGADLAIIDKKIAAATLFTNSLTTDAATKAYSGDAANVVVRTMLGTVNANTDLTAFKTSVDTTIQQLITLQSSTVTYAQVAALIDKHCVMCHSAPPFVPDQGLGTPIRYETSAQIHADAARIYNTVVTTRTMPYNNITGMTEAERTMISDWYKAGAP